MRGIADHQGSLPLMVFHQQGCIVGLVIGVPRLIVEEQRLKRDSSIKEKLGLPVQILVALLFLATVQASKKNSLRMAFPV